MMPRKPEGDRPLTPAERQARQHQQKIAWRVALERVVAAGTIREARQIAAEALAKRTKP